MGDTAIRRYGEWAKGRRGAYAKRLRRSNIFIACVRKQIRLAPSERNRVFVACRSSGTSGEVGFFALPPSPLQQLNLVPLQYLVQIVRIDQGN